MSHSCHCALPFLEFGPYFNNVQNKRGILLFCHSIALSLRACCRQFDIGPIGMPQNPISGRYTYTNPINASDLSKPELSVRGLSYHPRHTRTGNACFGKLQKVPKTYKLATNFFGPECGQRQPEKQSMRNARGAGTAREISGGRRERYLGRDRLGRPAGL